MVAQFPEKGKALFDFNPFLTKKMILWKCLAKSFLTLVYLNKRMRSKEAPIWGFGRVISEKSSIKAIELRM